MDAETVSVIPRAASSATCAGVNRAGLQPLTLGSGRRYRTGGDHGQWGEGPPSESASQPRRSAKSAEFLCGARDLRTWSQPQAREAIRNRMRATGSSDFTSRKLLSPVALADEEARAHLQMVQSKGTSVRISSSPMPHETILIDRRVMILAGRHTPTGREYTVTTSRTLVDGVHSLFQAIWDTATDLNAYLRGNGPHLDTDGRVILQSLASGITDASAAKQLGISLRTYRRRVADLMAKLEADSRFQAGLRAGELGIPR
ncbi:DNA-binding response regulator [Streptomyces sp. NPDC056883]|uniref:DNA-binding response regulator n=1 Tax=Streptomyces sp. NPDC056883 TaxID=3345959 RepID=UPI0036A14DD3